MRNYPRERLIKDCRKFDTECLLRVRERSHEERSRIARVQALEEFLFLTARKIMRGSSNRGNRGRVNKPSRFFWLEWCFLFSPVCTGVASRARYQAFKRVYSP